MSIVITPSGEIIQCAGEVGIDTEGTDCFCGDNLPRVCCIDTNCVAGLTQEECVAAGGVLHPTATSCSPNPCLAPIDSCVQTNGQLCANDCPSTYTIIAAWKGCCTSLDFPGESCSYDHSHSVQVVFLGVGVGTCFWAPSPSPPCGSGSVHCVSGNRFRVVASVLFGACGFCPIPGGNPNHTQPTCSFIKGFADYNPGQFEYCPPLGTYTTDCPGPPGCHDCSVALA